MADKPINLRLRRKQRARDEKRTKGDAATAVAGISAKQRKTASKITRLDTKRHDGHKLDTPDADD